jgi:hypothetical protein
MRQILLFLAAAAPFVLNSCGGYGRVGLAEAPKIVNVSSFDPKEKQRVGVSFSSGNVSSLRSNGALGLIARCGKGLVLDEKCADFLNSAHREGMLLVPNITTSARGNRPPTSAPWTGLWSTMPSTARAGSSPRFGRNTRGCPAETASMGSTRASRVVFGALAEDRRFRPFPSVFRHTTQNARPPSPQSHGTAHPPRADPPPAGR